jgi:hypothetical protein
MSLNNAVIAALVSNNAVIARTANATRSWEKEAAEVKEVKEVADALARLHKPGRQGWKVRRQEALKSAVLNALSAQALKAGEGSAALLGLDRRHGQVYAQRWMEVWAETTVNTQGRAALAHSKATEALRRVQDMNWLQKVAQGEPVVKNGLALLGLAIAHAAWLELGEELQKEAMYWMGMSKDAVFLRDTAVLVGGRDRLVGNNLSPAAELCSGWALEARVLERNGVFSAATETAKKGWGLKDVNTFFNNCGHYPEWAVVRGGEYSTRAAAQAAAAEKNQISGKAWAAFLNG